MGINTFPAASSSGVNYTGGSQASRPGSPTTGNTFFNTTDNSLEIYNGTDWVTIQETNDVPVWTTASGSLGSIVEGAALSFTVVATDPEGTAIVYSSADLPAGISINSSTGVISGTAPTVATDTTYTFTVSASDGLNQKTRSFSYTVNNGVPVEYLVVAGGAGGGMGDAANYGGGGSGAGGFRTGNTSALLSTNYAVTVGAGGATRTTIGTGNSGNNSSFSTITSTGGGGGGSRTSSPATGGSGGGSARNENGAAGTASQGNAGGNCSVTASNSGAGGGGAGGAGGNRTGEPGGAGGIGTISSITGTSTYYAGGGAGNGSTTVSGGAGGGGDGSNYNVAPYLGGNGQANTGGGGGGGGAGASSSSGGSGVVILRYLTSAGTITIGAGLTGSTATDGSYKVTTITAGTGNVSWA